MGLGGEGAELGVETQCQETLSSPGEGGKDLSKTPLPCLPGYKRHLRKVFHLSILRRNIPIICRLNSKGWGIGITGKQGPVLIHT